MSYKFTVTGDNESRRLDKTLRSIWPSLTVGEVMKNIRKGQVRVNGKKADPSYLLVRDDTVSAPWDEPGDKRVAISTLSLPVIYRDENIIVIDKPPGLLSQPSVKGGDSVITRVWNMETQKRHFSPAPVNRLDRNTSGIMVVALGGKALRELQVAFRNGNAEKIYYALVSGRPFAEGIINQPLLKDPSSNIVKVDAGGKESETRFKLLESDGNISLVEVELLTGRPHQARVHLAWAGYPVIGDRKYGDLASNSIMADKKIKRPMLHSAFLRFRDLEGEMAYLTGKGFTAPLPDDMKCFIDKETC